MDVLFQFRQRGTFVSLDDLIGLIGARVRAGERAGDSYGFLNVYRGFLMGLSQIARDLSCSRPHILSPVIRDQ